MMVVGIVHRRPTHTTSNQRILISTNNRLSHINFRTFHLVAYQLCLRASIGPLFWSTMKYCINDNLYAMYIPGIMRNNNPITIANAIKIYAIMYLPNRCILENNVLVVHDLFWFVRIAISANHSPSHIPIIDPMKSTGRYHTSGPNHICTHVYCDTHDVSNWAAPMMTTITASFQNCFLVWLQPWLIACLILRHENFVVAVFVVLLVVTFFPFMIVSFFFATLLLFIFILKLKGDIHISYSFCLCMQDIVYCTVIGNFAMVCHSNAISITLAPLLRHVTVILNTPSVIRLIDT